MAWTNTRRFEFVDGKSSKFWQIEIDGRQTRVIFGRIGTDGSEKIKDFDSAAEAQKEYDALIREKTKKGYGEVGGAGGAAPAPVAPKKPAEPAAEPSRKSAKQAAPKEAPAPVTAADQEGSPWLVKPKYLNRSSGLKSLPDSLKKLAAQAHSFANGIHEEDVPLYEGALSGDIGLIRDGLTRKTNVNVKYPSVGTPLSVAAQYGRALACEYLISMGAYIFADRGSGQQPIHDAAETGNRETVEVLVRYGAKVDRQACHIRPIGFAIARSNAETVEALLDMGSSLELPTNIMEYRPLLHAVLHDSPACAQLLIRRGASIRHNRKEMPPLLLAASEAMVRVLVAGGCDPNTKDDFTWTTPDWSPGRTIYYSQTDLRSNFYMANTALPDRGLTPLHAAAVRRRPSVIKALLAFGADPTLTDGAGNTPAQAFPLFDVKGPKGNDKDVAELLALRGPELESFRQRERARIESTPLELKGNIDAKAFDLF